MRQAVQFPAVAGRETPDGEEDHRRIPLDPGPSQSRSRLPVDRRHRDRDHRLDLLIGPTWPIYSARPARPIVSFLRVLMIGILFGLAMDYEVTGD